MRSSCPAPAPERPELGSGLALEYQGLGTRILGSRVVRFKCAAAAPLRPLSGLASGYQGLGSRIVGVRVGLFQMLGKLGYPGLGTLIGFRVVGLF